MEFIFIIDVEDMEEEYIFEYREFLPALADNLELKNEIDIIFIYIDSQFMRQEFLNED
jgi:hypothetical protein